MRRWGKVISIPTHTTEVVPHPRKRCKLRPAASSLRGAIGTAKRRRPSNGYGDEAIQAEAPSWIASSRCALLAMTSGPDRHRQAKGIVRRRIGERHGGAGGNAARDGGAGEGIEHIVGAGAFW